MILMKLMNTNKDATISPSLLVEKLKQRLILKIIDLFLS
jgi:hypothetical protein